MSAISYSRRRRKVTAGLKQGEAMNDIMTDGEWSYLRQSAVDRMANGTETATIEMTMLVDLVAQIDALRRSRDELISSLDGAMVFKRSVDAALNSGDGSYRP